MSFYTWVSNADPNERTSRIKLRDGALVFVKGSWADITDQEYYELSQRYVLVSGQVGTGPSDVDPTYLVSNAITTSTHAGNYTVTELDAASRMRMTNTSAAVISIPTLDVPIGTTIEISRMGSGTVSVVGVDPVTVLTPDGVGTAISSQNASVMLVKDGEDPDVWLASGSLS